MIQVSDVLDCCHGRMCATREAGEAFVAERARS
jgi:hypothetical protein